MRKFVLCILICILFSTNIYGDTASIILDGNEEYKAVELTPEVYNNANNNLSDILILDSNDEPVPYFLSSISTYVNSPIVKKYTMTMIDNFIKKDDEFFDYYYESEDDVDIVSTSISIDTSTKLFATEIQLLGSYDGINWNFVQDDILFRVDGSEKLTVNFNTPQKFNYFRFKIVDNVDKLYFSNAYLTYSEVIIDRMYFTDTMVPNFTQKEEGKNTFIEIEGLKNIKIDTITIKSDSQFKRNLYYKNINETIYNLSFSDTAYTDTTIDIEGIANRDDILTLEIFNGDDKPIKVDEIIVTYFFDKVIFKDNGSNKYTLFFNDDEVVSPPFYDIANYKELVLNEGYDTLELESISKDTEPIVVGAFDYTMIFNVIILMTALLLFFIIISRLKDSSQK